MLTWSEPDLLHPSLASALESTCGVVVFHEQILQIVAITAGVSLAQADEVRRARDAGACIVVVTHDYEFVCAACDQVAVLEDGVVSDVLPVRGEALGRIRRAIGIDGRARPL